MTKLSTPLSTIVSVKENKTVAGPARITLERIRQVARAYTSLSSNTALGGMILN